MNKIEKLYGNRVRLRVCGLLEQEGQLLMVNHRGLSAGNFWAPPGGGVEFGERVEEALVREFAEETGLAIEVGELRFLYQFMSNNLHSVEIFFSIKKWKGKLICGIDPESGSRQIITHTKFLKWSEIAGLQKNEKHGIFLLLSSPEEIMALSGLF